MAKVADHYSKQVPTSFA